MRKTGYENGLESAKVRITNKEDVKTKQNNIHSASKQKMEVEEKKQKREKQTADFCYFQQAPIHFFLQLPCVSYTDYFSLIFINVFCFFMSCF